MANRLTKYFEQGDRGRNRPSDSQEPFVMCPASLLAGLTPEQFAAQQQIYKVAHEKAQAQVARRQADGWGDSGAGI